MTALTPQRVAEALDRAGAEAADLVMAHGLPPELGEAAARATAELKAAADPLARQVNRLSDVVLSQAAALVGIGAPHAPRSFTDVGFWDRRAILRDAVLTAEDVRAQNEADWEAIWQALKAAGQAALQVLLPLLVAAL